MRLIGWFDLTKSNILGVLERRNLDTDTHGGEEEVGRHRERDHVKMEADIGVVLLPARKTRLEEAGRGRKGPLFSSLGDPGPAEVLTSDLQL